MLLNVRDNTKHGQKHLIFHLVPHLRVPDGSGFVKKSIVKYIEDTNDNITEANIMTIVSVYWFR